MMLEEELYRKIVRCLPIVCVDLLITNKEGLILLVKRLNPPGIGEWWFPGGRTLFKELRADAVLRKLKQECDLAPMSFKELGTYEIILDRETDGTTAHSVTTLYHVLAHDGEIKLDSQSSESAWKTAKEWIELTPYEWLRHRLQEWDSGVLGVAHR